MTVVGKVVALMLVKLVKAVIFVGEVLELVVLLITIESAYTDELIGKVVKKCSYC